MYGTRTIDPGKTWTTPEDGCPRARRAKTRTVRKPSARQNSAADSPLSTSRAFRFARVLSSERPVPQLDSFTRRYDSYVQGLCARYRDATGVARIFCSRIYGWTRSRDLRRPGTRHHRQSRFRALLPCPCEHARGFARFHPRAVDFLAGGELSHR